MMSPVIQTLLASQRFPHGIIFTGSDMPSLENALQHVLMSQECLARQGVTACTHCSNCIKIAKHLHTDVYVLSSQGKEITLDAIKEGMHWLMVAPTETQFRYLVIKDAEWLSRSSSNALLKLLEEPPSHGRLFFMTCNHHELLQTIRSRTFHVRIPSNLNSTASVSAETLPPLIDQALALFENPQRKDLPPWFDILEDLSQNKELLAVFFKHLFEKSRQRIENLPKEQRTLSQHDEGFLELILQTESSVLNHYGNATLHLNHLFHSWRTR